MGSRSVGPDSLVTIVDYNMGNVRSVMKAFKHLGKKVIISNSVSDIKRADYLVLPGVGAFYEGMENLRKLGLIEVLREEVFGNKKPLLGICLGMQLLAEDSDEFGFHKGLGWVEGSVKKLDPGDNLKVPHVGWNEVEIVDSACPLFQETGQKPAFYFTHSYHFIPAEEKNIKAICNYGQNFAASIQKGNIFAVQFHPEKSQLVGLKVLENFLKHG